ncbi:uncharacterized protein K452DRAFT_286059 [Aplosporella prunicola CBS 121167]|uniref:Uncharacterized protein n=1 Tax=Aplosporella prunicola CBS 121167 TaxID=1176127 RepID=A0A6A6BGY2_9PEZI|nr:uncharacterized protein K452DRAFT_286059 [Aplosporella prunicola CBS 121167]KAF2143236.1 hypothetical protein K452DRAFT_286059 [Aplosporella prunicola CBS 121167]
MARVAGRCNDAEKPPEVCLYGAFPTSGKRGRQRTGDAVTTTRLSALRLPDIDIMTPFIRSLLL